MRYVDRSWVSLTVCALMCVGCERPHAPAKSASAPPAKVGKTVAEAELNIVELTEAAEQRLAVQTASIEQRSVERRQSYGAELTLPIGASVLASAPLAGTVQLVQGKSLPQVGTRVSDQQPILALLPLLSPERAVLTPAERIRFAEAKTTLAQSRIDAAGQVQQAEVQVEAAEIALSRAERLLREQAGTVRAADEARAQLQLAQKSREAAQLRKQLVDSVQLDEEAGKVMELTINAPLSGVLRSLPVRSGEVLAAGSPLFEIINDDVLWIKVPVYVGDLSDVDRSAPAVVQLLGSRASESTITANPIAAPPSALPLASAVDLYYELPNREQQFAPGQRVNAQLKLAGDVERLVVPWSAVIHDVYGGQWIYEVVGERKYVRRRVEIGWVNDDGAVLIRGPKAGTRVVTAGAAELAGTEFGFAK